MSKSRRDGEDWKSGSDALFRAVRDDHEASADDYARVEAELARRLAAGAVPKIDVVTPVTSANLSGALTTSTVAKLGIGMLLLAAGSFGIARMFNVGSSVDTQPAPSLPLPAAEIGRAPVPTTTESLAASRDQSSARVPLAGSGPHLTQPSASHSAAATTPAGASAAKPTSLRAPSNVASRMPRASAKGRSPASVAARRAARDEAEPTFAQVAASASEGTKRMPASVAAPGGAEDAIEQTATSEAAKRMPASVAARDASTRQPSVRPTPRKQDDSAPQRDSEAEPAVAQATSTTRPAANHSDQDDSRAELALIERMHAAMRVGKPAHALELCAEHAERWPRGVFAEEREAVRAIASCALRADDAVARAQLFLRKHPRAPTAERVAAACAPLSAATKPASIH